MKVRKSLLSFLFITVFIPAPSPLLSQPADALWQQKRTEAHIQENLRKYFLALSCGEQDTNNVKNDFLSTDTGLIITEYKSLNLLPAGANETYTESTELGNLKQPQAENVFKIDNWVLDNADYIHFPWSAPLKMEKTTFLALLEEGEPWWYDVKDSLLLNANNPYFSIELHIKNIAKIVAAKGAAALFIYNTYDLENKLFFNGKDTADVVAIPVVFLDPDFTKKVGISVGSAPYVEASLAFYNKPIISSSVAAYINNNAENTIVLAASLNKNKITTAAMLQLADIIKEKCTTEREQIEMTAWLSNNYLFIHFDTGYNEAFNKQNATNMLHSNHIRFIINTTMSQNDSNSNTIFIGGTSSSPDWLQILNAEKYAAYNLVIDSCENIVSDDKTLFCPQNIPVLYFIQANDEATKQKQSQNADWVNYEGITHKINFIVNTIEQAAARTNRLPLP